MRRHDTEVLIVGAGPAGLTAARTAAGQGSRVLLVDDNPRPGGQIWRDGPNAELPAAAAQLRAAVKNSGVELMTGARVVGAPEAHPIAGDRRGNHTRIQSSTDSVHGRS
jgi:NADPH-dependent 2,4-dienoyl-CoA reductase/sulfur reductase-like enzyme